MNKKNWRKMARHYRRRWAELESMRQVAVTVLLLPDDSFRNKCGMVTRILTSCDELASLDRVGIGTVAPAQKLHVACLDEGEQ